MNQRTRIFLPIILALVIVFSCVGGWLWYDNNVDRSGWVDIDGVRIYRDFHANPVSGWLELADGTYHFREDGTPYTGWADIDGTTYYFSDTGIMTTGWLELEGKQHYFGGNGALVEGWLWLEEGRYYLTDGAVVTGWQKIGRDQYYFDGNGIMADGLTVLEDKTYFFSDGVMHTGPLELENEQFFFGEDGAMHTGWLETEEGKAYFRSDGTQAFGWEEIDGERCYFDGKGILCLDKWVQEGEYRYYIFGDGTLATGPTVIDGKTHYFTPKGIEVILVNALNPLPEGLDQTFVNVVEKHKVDSRCYDALVAMLEEFEETVGIEYTFNSAYRDTEEQTAILEYRTLEHMRDYGLTFREAREKALSTVAIPGTSEHQLGLSVDLVGYSINQWLAEHCWDYGFILRYPENKQHITGITNEPWHFRYVGTEVSLDMKDTGLCLEEYLGAEPVTPEAVRAFHGDKWYREEFFTVDDEIIANYIGTDEETPSDD